MPKLKFIIAIIVIYFTIFFSIYLNLPHYHYTIKQNLSTYRTNSYIKNADGCISFNCNQGNITMCGNYTIEEKFAR